MNRLDSDIDSKVRVVIRFINETLQYNANEPALALYRMQEHVQKTLPSMIQKRYELENLQERMNGLVFDVEYSVEAVTHLGTSDDHVKNIITSLDKAVYITKQINLFRQQQIQQQLFEKKDGPLLVTLKN